MINKLYIHPLSIKNGLSSKFVKFIFFQMFFDKQDLLD